MPDAQTCQHIVSRPYLAGVATVNSYCGAPAGFWCTAEGAWLCAEHRHLEARCCVAVQEREEA